MKRRLFNLFAIMSLLVFIGAIFLWFRSYSYVDWVAFTIGDRQFELQSGAGQITFAVSSFIQSGWHSTQRSCGRGPTCLNLHGEHLNS